MSARRRPLPPTYFFGAIVLLVVLHLLLPVRTVVPWPWNLLGLVLAGAGSAVTGAADRLFKEKGTTVKPDQESSVLVTSSVFRWSRNPMYLGFVLILLGLGVLAGSAGALLPWIVFGIAMDHAFIRKEEAMLAARFPREWEEYCRRVRRWV